MADWKDRMDSSIDNNTICAHCGEVYGEHFGMRCSNEGDGTTFVAASPSAPAGQAEWTCGCNVEQTDDHCVMCGKTAPEFWPGWNDDPPPVVQQASVQPAGTMEAWVKLSTLEQHHLLSQGHPHPLAPQPAAQSGGDWRIDASAGSEILVYKNCSVIEGEQAHWVLGLIKAAPPAQSAVTDEQIEAIGAKIYGTCFTPADRQFAREVLALASSARRPLTNNQIRKWWALDNGLEDCDMCKFDDFQAVVRAVEAKHGIAATQAERPAGEEKP